MSEQGFFESYEEPLHISEEFIELPKSELPNKKEIIPNQKRKLWVASVRMHLGNVTMYTTSVYYNIDDDIDDLIEKIHKKMHIEFKDIDVSHLSLRYGKNNEPTIKRNVMVIDALKKAKELEIENSIDFPFLIVRGV